MKRLEISRELLWIILREKCYTNMDSVLNIMGLLIKIEELQRNYMTE
jgi:hypothetical protein